MATLKYYKFQVALATGVLCLIALALLAESSPLDSSFDSEPGVMPFMEELDVPDQELQNSEYGGDIRPALITFKQILLNSSLDDCCPAWSNLSQIIPLGQKSRYYGYSRIVTLTTSDLVRELNRAFNNISQLSIEGQEGFNERERYYNFYDSVQYYLRLVKVSKQYLSNLPSNSTANETEFSRKTKRLLKTYEFKVHQNPQLSTFVAELTDRTNLNKANFEFFEDFIRYTKFGRDYASNISLVRESAQVFDQIYAHLTSANFPSNLTRPSKQYEMIRAMSQELFRVYHYVDIQVDPHIALHRPEVRAMLRKLTLITQQRPYVRLLGDMYDPNLKSHVITFTSLLDRYLANQLTYVSFYNQLYDLPEGFIALGAKIAHDYEDREIPHLSELRNNRVGLRGPTYQVVEGGKRVN